MLNNRALVDLGNGSCTSVVVPAGEYNIVGGQGFLAWPRKERLIKVEDGKTYFLVWQFDTTWWFIIPQVDLESVRWDSVETEVAQKLLAKTDYVAPLPEKTRKD